MNSKIRTNQLVYNIERVEITKQYDIFALKTSDKYIKRGSYILDAVSMDNDIKALKFESGRCAYLLMLHDVNNKRKLKEIISGIDGGDCLYIEEMDIHKVADALLLQLLINALSSYDSKLLKCNNLTGHFYCFHPSWIIYGKESHRHRLWFGLGKSRTG